MNFAQRLAYSMGNFGNTLAQQVFSNRIQFFYLRVLGLPPEIVGGVWSIFGLWNAVNDPLMGQLTDRTHSRWGRRIPYLLFGALPLGLSFILLWTVPTGNVWVTALYFLATVFIFDTLLTLLTVAYNALFTEATKDVRQRSALSALREFAAVIALLLAFILAPILSRSVGFVMMGVIVGFLAALGYFIAAFSTREDPSHMEREVIGIWDSLKLSLQSIPFRWYLGANLMKEAVFLLLAATLPFWVEFALGIRGPGDIFGMRLSAGDQEAALLAAPFLLALPLLVVWRAITPGLGTRRAWMLANVLFIPGLVVMWLARDFQTGLLGTVLISPGLAGYMMLPIVLLSAVIEDDAQRTQVRREGMFFGINGAVVKLSFTAQGLLYALVFRVTGWVSGADTQTEAAIGGIRFLMAGLPALCCLLAVYFLYRVHVSERGAPATVATTTPAAK